ncbi:uncharacterized protein PAC_09432 [Phialocephala subalpina]|uniref:Uncharacterized protein n=1 Tax=Phialocephala subalpina TaxID=576137 RepID=A0A1L7X3E2_9HELO|nr:uncharacterized protein PAC_09432 [Phialocephala subalpina]
MSQLLTSRWEPSDVLNIITPRNDISCAGFTQQGLPCRWRLDGEIKAQIRSLLLQMSEKSPRRALGDLPELARLCLCETNHRNQATRVLDTWTPLVERYASWLESRDTHQPQELDCSPDDKIDGSSNRNVRHSGSRSASPSVDDIMAELEALSIRQKQLQRALQHLLPPTGNQRPNSSSVQSTPSSVVITPLDESPSSSQQSLGGGARSFKKFFGSRKG